MPFRTYDEWKAHDPADDEPNPVDDFYPDDWPRCPACGDHALDGHITCGRVECDEAGHR